MGSGKLLSGKHLAKSAPLPKLNGGPKGGGSGKFSKGGKK